MLFGKDLGKETTQDRKEYDVLTRNHQTQASSLLIELLIANGAIGPTLFIVIFLIEGATRPAYSAWHNFVSELSLGDQGWVQITSFLICGICILCFAFGLRRMFRSGKGAVGGPILLGVFGLSLIVAGLFVIDPGLGYYPAGMASISHTLHGAIHGASAPAAFGSLTIAMFVLARRFASDPPWHSWTLPTQIAAAIVVSSFIACLATAILDQQGILPHSPSGLLERISLIVGCGWIALLALRLFRQVRSSTTSMDS